MRKERRTSGMKYVEDLFKAIVIAIGLVIGLGLLVIIGLLLGAGIHAIFN